MNWIQTFTGRKFFPLDPRPENIDIRDIAHALSLTCRFNGHCRVFYSVAEHSLRVSQALPPHFALWGLLHDAAEAYLCDLPRPVKRQMPEFSVIEDRLLRVVVTRFGLDFPMPPKVKEADDILLATEARDIMAPAPENWCGQASALDVPIVPVSATDAEDAYLESFHRLRGSALV